MAHYDLNKVHSISLDQWGSDYYEALDIFREKLNVYPEGCFVYDVDGRVQGYVISHPWDTESYPPLNQKFRNGLRFRGYYIHDIVLTPEYRGGQIAAEIIHKILGEHNVVTLVAPEPTHHYWKKYYGFEKTGVKTPIGVHMIRGTVGSLR